MRQTIAIDIDDVLADQAEAFLEFSNKTWGTQFEIDDYTEHWLDLWKVDMAEVESRADFYHKSGTMSRFRHKSDALPILEHLKKRYNLVIVTSRRSQVKSETYEWIERHFNGVFDGIHFAGFFDTLSLDRVRMTKADIVKGIGAHYLVDDQIKHCEATAAAGMDCVLFGDYGWNRQDQLPPRVTRCVAWREVGEYFDKRG